MFKGILTSLIDGVSSFFKGKQELSKIKLESQKTLIIAQAQAELAISEAKMQMAKTGQSNEYNLDMMAMKNMKTSYKDEFLLIAFMAPMILAFIPGFDKIALDGFNVIAQMPDWYTYVIIGMVVRIYGLGGLLKAIMNKKLKLGK
jgi:hypothetical protein